MIKIRELIKRLQEIDPEWEAEGTNHGSIAVYEPHDLTEWKGKKYGYVFLDERSNRMCVHRV